jgi:hypothetical protein
MQSNVRQCITHCLPLLKRTIAITEKRSKHRQRIGTFIGEITKCINRGETHDLVIIE